MKKGIVSILLIIALFFNAATINAHCHGPHGPATPTPTDEGKK
jgi:hypothetical protein